jgi:preprotein translocase subunit YajC
MLFTSAYAQEGDAGAEGAPVDGGGLGMIGSLLPLILIFVVFYFLLIRPQQKKMKAHRALVAAARRGDRVVTQGGIIGTVTKILNDSEIMVEVAEGVRVRVLKHTLTDIINKGDARAAEAAAAKPADTPGGSSSGGGGGMLGRFRKSSS